MAVRNGHVPVGGIRGPVELEVGAVEDWLDGGLAASTATALDGGACPLGWAPVRPVPPISPTPSPITSTAARPTAPYAVQGPLRRELNAIAL